MSKEKEIINKLFKVVAKQQEIITKLAQNTETATTGTSDLKASVQADLTDLIYGKGAKLVPGRTYIQVHYAKLQQGPNGNALVVGVAIPPNVQEKWQQMKSSIETPLKNKYQVSSIAFRE